MMVKFEDMPGILLGLGLLLAIAMIAGCAPTYYAGDGVVTDRYGDSWERCHVGRYGRPAWCRVD
jgi:hypothetical protein